jgi:hypothetical protein
VRVSTETLSNKERALYLEEPKSVRQAIAFLAGPSKKAEAKKEKGGSGGADAEDEIERVTSLAKRLLDTLAKAISLSDNLALASGRRSKAFPSQARRPAPSLLSKIDRRRVAGRFPVNYKFVMRPAGRSAVRLGCGRDGPRRRTVRRARTVAAGTASHRRDPLLQEERRGAGFHVNPRSRN